MFGDSGSNGFLYQKCGVDHRINGYFALIFWANDELQNAEIGTGMFVSGDRLWNSLNVMICDFLVEILEELILLERMFKKSLRLSNGLA